MSSNKEDQPAVSRPVITFSLNKPASKVKQVDNDFETAPKSEGPRLPSTFTPVAADTEVQPAATAGFGSFTWKRPETSKQDQDDDEMAKMMGFSGFGTTKKQPVEKMAKNFDVNKMVTESIRQARNALASTTVSSSSKDSDEDDDDEQDGDDVPTSSSIKKNMSLDADFTSLDNERVKLYNAMSGIGHEKSSKSSSSSEDEDNEDGVIGPMPVGMGTLTDKTKGKKSKSLKKNLGEDDDDTDSGSDSDDADKTPTFPLSEERVLVHGVRAVTTVAVDPAATRFATGCTGYEVKLWDFAGLKNRHAFRAMKPCESHPIQNLSYSSSGDSLLIISGNAQAKVVDRDGTELLECVKGDQYIVDMSRTKGHVGGLTGGQFNPKQKNIFMTSSIDGTCRLWDVNNPRHHKTCVKVRGRTGLKNVVTTCCFTRDGNCYVGAGFDGTIHMWDSRKAAVVPASTIKSAHESGTETFTLTFSNSGLYLVTRGEDGMLKIWDVRNWKIPIYSTNKYPAKFNTTNVSFSPDDRHLLIPALPEGVSGRMKEESIEYSTLNFVQMSNHSLIKELRIPGKIVISTAWHHRLNQIIATYNTGDYCIYYDLEKSHRGAVISHGLEPKRVRSREVIEDFSGKVIITPNSLPMFKSEKPRNPKREEIKARLDPLKSRRPDLPITAGSGGRVAASGSTLSSYVIRNLGLSKSVKDDMDPREAILRYAKEAADNPIWVTPAYKTTQPVPIFHNEEEDEEPEQKKSKLL